MTDNNHPITPPDELVQEWMTEIWHEGTPVRVAASDLHIATQSARWGADQQLEACCEWVGDGRRENLSQVIALRAACRPKPKSQAEKALASLDGVALPEEAWQAVSAALERLRELEKSND